VQKSYSQSLIGYEVDNFFGMDEDDGGCGEGGTRGFGALNTHTVTTRETDSFFDPASSSLLNLTSCYRGSAVEAFAEVVI
jgi:hypothetical protein